MVLFVFLLLLGGYGWLFGPRFPHGVESRGVTHCLDCRVGMWRNRAERLAFREILFKKYINGRSPLVSADSMNEDDGSNSDDRSIQTASNFEHPILVREI